MARLWIMLFLLCPGLGWAQGAATLIADSVRLNGQDQLIASGNVEVLYDGSRLTASEILYDRSTDSLQVTGPIYIRASDGTILTADSATLDPRLENGILQGARLVLEQELQLVAAQIDQREGRYTQLYKTSATSCRVCGTGPPLWEIRAERVIRDAEARQLYFENATFRVRGIPLFWLPRMRLPDPTLARATGFLVPSQQNTTQLGTGLKLPYFITLGDSRDLTLTPYVSSETRTLELRYRQAFARGDLAVEGAVSNDSLTANLRSYAFVTGEFALPNRYQLSFDVETASDTAYLLDYGYSDKDRLDSAIALTRVTDATAFQARATYFESLRDDETNASLPPFIADLRYQARLRPAFGGVIETGAGLDTLYRTETTDGGAGRDVTRAGMTGTWHGTQIMAGGLVLQGQAGARADVYLVDDDDAFEATSLQAAPHAGLTLRWPLARQTQTGATHVIEPVAYLGWAKAYGDAIPNEDSTRSELDRANLFAPSRFAGEDAVQTGAQAALGVTWTRLGRGNRSSALSFGRVVAQDDDPRFNATSGLDGTRSDWLVAGQFTAPGGFLIEARSLWADDGGLNVADGRIAWQNDSVSLAANYNWQTPDTDDDDGDTVSEWTLDGTFDLNAAWTLEMDARYNVAEDSPVSAALGLEWRNECVSIDVSVSRRYTSSDNVEPSTTFGLSGSIGGFSTGRRTSGIAAGCGN